jgi:hypothetical protein
MADEGFPMRVVSGMGEPHHDDASMIYGQTN